MFTRALLFAAVVLAGNTPAVAVNDWIFDYGPYSANPTTGHRVDQYKKAKVAKRIPYAKYFSDDGPAPYIPYQFYQDELGPLNGFFGGGGYYGGGGFAGGYGISTGSAMGGFAIP
jgi:hypothetical protein